MRVLPSNAQFAYQCLTAVGKTLLQTHCHRRNAASVES